MELNITNIEQLYKVATLAKEVHETYDKLYEVEMESHEIYDNAKEHTYEEMLAVDKKVSKAESDFRKAVKAVHSHFGLVPVDKWNGRKPIKKGAYSHTWRDAYNEVMSHEYGIYSTQLDWEKINLIKQADKMSDYTLSLTERR